MPKGDFVFFFFLFLVARKLPMEPDVKIDPQRPVIRTERGQIVHNY